MECCDSFEVFDFLYFVNLVVEKKTITIEFILHPLHTGISNMSTHAQSNKKRELSSPLDISEIKKSRAFSPTMAEDIQSDPIAHIRLDEYDIQAISTIVESAEMTYQISIQ